MNLTLYHGWLVLLMRGSNSVSTIIIIINTNRIPVAHAIEYYNVLKVLPNHHNTNTALKLLRRGGLSSLKAKAVLTGIINDDDTKAIIASDMKDYIRNLTGYITVILRLLRILVVVIHHSIPTQPLLTKLIISSTITTLRGCRFNIRGTGLDVRRLVACCLLLTSHTTSLSSLSSVHYIPFIVIIPSYSLFFLTICIIGRIL